MEHSKGDLIKLTDNSIWEIESIRHVYTTMGIKEKRYTLINENFVLKHNVRPEEIKPENAHA